MIDRRDFLKLSGLFSAVMIAGAGTMLEIKAHAVEAELHGKFYRGASDGKVFVSEDAGKTWRLHTDLGSQLSVSHLYTDSRQRLVAVLDCEGYDFKLALASDARSWRTM